MLTICPRCEKPLSVPKPGPQVCHKCGALIFIGDPMRDEENRILKEKVVTPKPPEPDSEEDEEVRKDDGVEPAEGAAPRGGVPSAERLAQSAPRWTPGVAWDRMGEIGFVEATYETTRDLLTAPRRFFTEMQMGPEPRFIPLYGVIVGIAGAAFNLFWVLWMVHNHRPLLEQYVPPALLDYFATMQTGDIIAQVLLSPIAGIVIAAFLLFAFSLLFGAKTQLHLFYRLAGFTAALDLFYAVPVIGWAVAFIWRSVLLVTGVRVITGLPLRRALAVFLIYLFLSALMLMPAGLSSGG